MSHQWINALFVSCLLIVPAQALAQDQLLSSYVADIRVEDHYNSSGTRLSTFAALLAQDRANYHRFGIRHEHDASDPIFADRAMRAQITDAVVVWEEYYDLYVQTILNSGGVGGSYLVVQVYGIGNQITRITFVVPG